MEAKLQKTAASLANECLHQKLTLSKEQVTMKADLNKSQKETISTLNATVTVTVRA
jgi:hypothetical protein